MQWKLACKMYLHYYTSMMHCIVPLKCKIISDSIVMFVCLFVSSVMSSISWPWFSPVLQSKQLQINVHRRLFSLHRSIGSTIFPRISVSIRTRPCSYPLDCGTQYILNEKFSLAITITITIFDSYCVSVSLCSSTI